MRFLNTCAPVCRWSLQTWEATGKQFLTARRDSSQSQRACRQADFPADAPRRISLPRSCRQGTRRNRILACYNDPQLSGVLHQTGGTVRKRVGRREGDGKTRLLYRVTRVPASGDFFYVGILRGTLHVPAGTRSVPLQRQCLFFKHALVNSTRHYRWRNGAIRCKPVSQSVDKLQQPRLVFRFENV
jgi:hypothetical protein